MHCTSFECTDFKRFKASSLSTMPCLMLETICMMAVSTCHTKERDDKIRLEHFFHQQVYDTKVESQFRQYQADR